MAIRRCSGHTFVAVLGVVLITLPAAAQVGDVTGGQDGAIDGARSESDIAQVTGSGIHAASWKDAGSVGHSSEKSNVGLAGSGSTKSQQQVSSCCAASGGATGCDDPACEARVCGLNETCCTIAWDSSCAETAASYCQVCEHLLGPPPCDSFSDPELMSPGRTGAPTDLKTDGLGNWLAVSVSNDDVGGMSIGTDNDLAFATIAGGFGESNGLLSFMPNAASDSGNDSTPRLATDGLGNWVAVWTSLDDLGGTIGADTDILVSRSTDNGSSWTSPTALNSEAATDGSAEDREPRIITDAAGTWIAVWRSNHDVGVTGTDKDIYFSRSTDNGVTWSAMTPVNTTALGDTGSDISPDLATDEAGVWVAVWSSNEDIGGGDGTDYDLYYSRSSDGGLTWSSPLDLSNASADAGADLSPKIAADGAGNWITVWDADGLQGGGSFGTDIAFVRSLDNGASWSVPALIPTVPNWNDRNASVATDKNGNWLVVWESNNTLGSTIGLDEDILFSRSTDLGASWSPIAVLNRQIYTDNPDTRPHAVSDAAGHFVVVWHSTENLGATVGTDGDILYSTSSDGGATWSTQLPVSVSARSDSASDGDPFLATDGSGHWVTVWSTNGTYNVGGTGTDNDLFTQRSTDNGVTWSPMVLMNSTGTGDLATDYAAMLAPDGLGNWVAVYASEGDVLVTRSTDAGDSWTTPAALHPNAELGSSVYLRPQIVSGTAGTLVAAWSTTDALGGSIGTDYDLVVSTSTDSGVNWTAPSPLNTTAATDTGDDRYLRLASDGVGTFVAVWRSNENIGGTTGTDNDLFVSRSADNGVTWSSPALLNPSGEGIIGIEDFNEFPAAIAYNGAGTWGAVWTSSGAVNCSPSCEHAARSTDGGLTWQAIAAPVFGYLPLSNQTLAMDASGTWGVVGSTFLTAPVQVYFRPSFDDGLTWPGISITGETVDGSLSGSTQSGALLATDGVGNWVLAFFDASAILVSRLRQPDVDGDWRPDSCDNCPNDADFEHLDTEYFANGFSPDGIGDVCDNCRFHRNDDQADGDSDGIGDRCDNCPRTSNPGQEDTDGDRFGDACQDDPGGIIYVDSNATGPAHDGTTWCSAFTSLSDAIAVSTLNSPTIRIADGTYFPDTAGLPDPREAYFRFPLANGSRIQGGYAGCGAPDPDARDFALYETTLSGDIGATGDESDNSYHVWAYDVLGDSFIADVYTALLEGVTITGGNANGSGTNSEGGGVRIKANPTFRDCRFVGNQTVGQGGGVYLTGGSIRGDDWSPVVIDCLFAQNTAGHGGGMTVRQNQALLRGCRFENNQALGVPGNDCGNGGGINMQAGTTGFGLPPDGKVLESCAFVNNTACLGGGAINLGAAEFTNCTFGYNASPSANGVGGITGNSGEVTTLRNSIAWGNTSGVLTACAWCNVGSGSFDISYTLIEDDDPTDGIVLFPGLGNIDENPVFLDPPGGDLRLRAGSPAIDTAENTFVTTLYDVDGNARIEDGDGDTVAIVDMGAHESPRCGDNIRQGGEACDGTDDAACPALCQTDCTCPPFCGDGSVDAGEQCDDGGETASCDDDCTFVYCGDGHTNETASETCDDAGESATCDDDCTTVACGDGNTNETAGEACDDGGESATCDADCTVALCGDGTVNATAGETCDDAGESATCDLDCTAAVCGDATINVTAGEACDDGGDSLTCDADCTGAQCGDGYTNSAAGEECDDGNLIDGDGCQSTCRWPGCGDGIVDGTEECDDVGESATCDADCTFAVCGDGTVNFTAGEVCDDAGESATCDTNCTIAACGDGTVNITAGEACDDAGESATCDTDCTAALCGDATINVTVGENCDDGGESAFCDADCTPAICGDGTVNVTAGEGCDDGGESPTCDADCTPAICGDVTVNATAGEECDDGGESVTCDADCTPALCGDATVNVTAGEECDDGAESATCDADCTFALCGDNVRNTSAGEQCDGTDDTQCPGACELDCTCPVTGACCDRSALICTDAVLGGACPNPTDEWYEGASCGSIYPPCELLLESFETFSYGAYSNIAAFSGDATVETMDGSTNLRISSSSTWSGRVVSPRTGSKMLKPTTPARWVFAMPIAGFGGYFATNAPVVGGTAEFYDSAGNLLNTLSLVIPGDQTWAWNEWQTSGAMIKRIEIRGVYGGGGNVFQDDVTYTPATGCGNGVVEIGEVCDDAGDSLSCDADCTAAECGDGYLNTTAGEECDDGNLMDGDACQSTCQLPGCGDGFVDATEECDDAGESATCDADCTFAGCGDATVNGTAGETCDDAGESATCDADCTLAGCGDGTVNGTAGETCDDAGESATCDADCTQAFCGDGTINATAEETCDDSGESATCDNDCTDAACGDGNTNTTAGEACDDADESATCDVDCSPAQCGDNYINVPAGEACDGTADAACPGLCHTDCTCGVEPQGACCVAGLCDFAVESACAGIFFESAQCDDLTCPLCGAAAPTPLADPILNASGVVVPSAKNRFLSFSGGDVGVPQAVRVRFVSLPGDFAIFDGTLAWVSQPFASSEKPGKGLTEPVDSDPTFMAARLGATPVFIDWSVLGMVHVLDELIVPSRKLPGQPLEPAVYEIQLISDGCDLGSEASYSAPLSITNARWCDLAQLAAGEYRAPDGIVAVDDTLAMLAKFAGSPDAPIKVRAELQGAGASGPEAAIDGRITVGELVAVVDAFSGGSYPFLVP